MRVTEVRHRKGCATPTAWTHHATSVPGWVLVRCLGCGIARLERLPVAPTSPTDHDIDQHGPRAFDPLQERR